MGTNSSDAGTRFRKLLARPQGVFAYGIHDGSSAKIAEMVGHEVLYVGGYAAAASRGLPDLEILTMPEMLQHAEFIAEAVSTPLIVDIDTGYGGVHNVIRTVRKFLNLPNVAGIHIEDQRPPKRCGHIAGKEVLPLEEFLGKLKAAIDTRNEIAPEKVIIARTDAFSAAGGKKDSNFGGDIDEAVRKGLAYAEAGADLIWCEFPSPDAISAVGFAALMRRRFPNLPLAFNISPSFKPGTWEQSKLTDQSLTMLGYRFRFCTYPSMVAQLVGGVRLSASESLQDPIQGLIALRKRAAGTPAESIMKFVGVGHYQEIEKRYDPNAEKRIQNSEGFKV